jgi:GR25 family glycosyltransferase involved in LPS biosynthesis
MSRAAVIHLDKAVERKPLVERIKEFFPALQIYPANDGSTWLADTRIAKAHPLTKMPVTQACIGCAYSHVDLIHDALSKQDAAIIIFEDDCEFKAEVVREDLTKYIHMANGLGEPWDILLLGGTEYVETLPAASTDYTKVGRFWGAHAFILRERGMRAALKVFHAAQKEGTFLLADWMYNEAIRQEKLVCFGPADPFKFCRQKAGLQSYLSGKLRTYREVSGSRYQKD